MPGKFWEHNPDGSVEGVVKARGQLSTRPADLVLAGQLDEAIDRMLDDAVAMVERIAAESPARANADDTKFLRWWSVGASIRAAGIREHEALPGEQPEFLDLVLSEKFRASIRSDGTKTALWNDLRPGDRDDGRRRNREGSAHGYDHWAMCVWLAEQEYREARDVFGGHIRNVWQMLDRPTLRPLVLRRALLTVLREMSNDAAAQLTSTYGFAELMKCLVQRWPGRGRRSALQPVHHKLDLANELRVLIGSAVGNA